MMSPNAGDVTTAASVAEDDVKDQTKMMTVLSTELGVSVNDETTEREDLTIKIGKFYPLSNDIVCGGDSNESHSEQPSCNLDAHKDENLEAECNQLLTCSTLKPQIDQCIIHPTEFGTNTEENSQESSTVEVHNEKKLEDSNNVPSNADHDLTLNSRLKRKKAVKIKRSKTDEGFKKLSFKRCNSLLEVEQNKSPGITTKTLAIRRSLANDTDIFRLEIANSDILSRFGDVESDVGTVSCAVTAGENSNISPPFEKCLSPVDTLSSDCFSPVEEPCFNFYPRLADFGNMSSIRTEGFRGLSRDGKVPPLEPMTAEPVTKSLFQRQKSIPGSLMSASSSSSGTSRDSTFLDDAVKKRGVVFRRKSSLVEEDRKPVSKRIFGTSKMSLQLLRKYSLASEYFTLRFENGEEQIVAAVKGIPLWQAISDLMERRGVHSMDQVDIFLESSKTPLPPTSDCFLLANTMLWVKAKEPKDDRKQLETNIRGSLSVSNLAAISLSSTDSAKEKRPPNGSVKNKKSVSSEDSNNFTDVSLYGSLHRNDLQKYRGATGVAPVATTSTTGTPAIKGHSKLQSLFNPFNKAQDKHEQLNELLNSYSLNGLPKMPDLLTLGRPHYDPHMFHVESHWTDIVMNHHTLNKRQRDQQEAIWELLTTEVEYIHKLKVIMDLFMCCLFNLQNEQLLNEIEAEKLFSNIGDVFYATCHFWTIHMSQVLRQARGRRELLNPCLLKAGFLVFEKIFDPYTKYCLEQENCREYIKQKTKENELFRTFIFWAESQKQCNRLKLVDLIVKPFQRLTKYKLLLYAMRKPLDKMDATLDVEEQKKDISIMIEQVENFVFKVNVAMRHRHDYKQMSQMIDRIESYDAIDPPSEECIKLVSKFCKLDLTCPVPGCSQQQMRILLLEGNLKLRDTYSKMDVYCFLFTDMLLITKPTAKRGDRVKIIKPPMRLDKIVVHSLRDVASFMLLYLNEYHMAQAVYTFHGDSKLWLENVVKAQNDYKEKRHNYLTRTDIYDDVDEECNIYIEQPSTANMSRHDSSGSADTFLPNYGVQRSTSCLDDPNHDSTQFSENQRPSSALQTRRHPYRSHLSVTHSRIGKGTSCESLNADLKDARFLTVPAISGKADRTHCTDDLELDYGSNDEDDIHESRFRTNQRRGARGDRRYRTADTIQDLKNQKDVNIQKRLSWNCGNAAVNLEDKDKMLGCESLRSMPSSSGVSSTASLHVASDGDVLRQTRLSDEEDARHVCAQSGCKHHAAGTHNGSARHTKTKSVETQTAISDLHDGLKFGNSTSSAKDMESFSNSLRQLSQSLPNIVEFAEESSKDAEPYSEVELPALSMPSTPKVLQRRNILSSQSCGFNQEFLLFNSTLEASDV